MFDDLNSFFDGFAMYLMMIFLAVAVIGMVMAIKNRVAHNKLTDLVKDDKLRDQLNDIDRLQKRPQKDDLKGWDNTSIDLGKAKGGWEKYKKPDKKPDSIDKLMDKLDEDEDKKDV